MSASHAGIHLNEAATGVMALEISVHVPTFAPNPSKSAPMKTPRESRNTTMPVQKESQSSLIAGLRCVTRRILEVKVASRQARIILLYPLLRASPQPAPFYLRLSPFSASAVKIPQLQVALPAQF